MGLKWIDSRELAIELSERYPDVDPVTVRFTDLRDWILELADFDDDPEHCSERVLEAVQMYWIEEAD
ncbi:Fe-S cluster assembly protein IscX [Photobacterium nomapromontoriensis]|uniref:Fe-S cluster assembly protein IscX n=1 Tax=Photobacterium nomapromontoriensis TaxID=2910237 RepID=UPI003D0E2C9D